MGEFHKIKVGDTTINSIDWEMTPELTFGTYESWGGRERVRNNDERIHYFFIDNWGERPKLCLMERGVKHARIVAEIDAPEDLASGSSTAPPYSLRNSIRRWCAPSGTGNTSPQVPWQGPFKSIHVTSRSHASSSSITP